MADAGLRNGTLTVEINIFFFKATHRFSGVQRLTCTSIDKTPEPFAGNSSLRVVLLRLSSAQESPGLVVVQGIL